MLVEVLSAFHKASAIIALAVSCQLDRKERTLRAVGVVAADVGFAFSTILPSTESVSHRKITPDAPRWCITCESGRVKRTFPTRGTIE
jgi:hypothetical protein